MPDDPIQAFLVRCEGGAQDGRTFESSVTVAADLPRLIRIEGETYELASASALPPHPGIIRGALYRYKEGP